MTKTVEEVLNEIKGKENSKGEITPNRFSKKNFNKLMTALANDTTFAAKIANVKKGELESVEDLLVTDEFRKWCQKLLVQAGFDKNDSAVVLDPNFKFNNMDGLYDFFVTAVYEYMQCGNKFDFLPREDFKGTVYIKNNKETTKRVSTRNPQTGEDLGTFDITSKPYKSLAVSSPCPDYLKSRKKVK